jgi:hypothetical protein
MRFTALRKLWLVVATLSLLATPAFASTALSFVCEGDQIARTECCCPGGHSSGAIGATDQATVSPACCCHVSRADARDKLAVAAPRVAAQTEAKVLPAPISLLPIETLAPSPGVRPAVRLAQPPPRAVPILLAKQSLLV